MYAPARREKRAATANMLRVRVRGLMSVRGR
jgi:hypothetical protein